MAVAVKLQFLVCLYKTYCSVSVSSPYLSLIRMHVTGFRAFPGGSDGKETACNAGDLSSIPGLGRSPGGGHGNPLQYSCLKNPHGQRSLEGYSPWGCKESDTTERLSTAPPPVILIYVISQWYAGKRLTTSSLEWRGGEEEALICRVC